MLIAVALVFLAYLFSPFIVWRNFFHLLVCTLRAPSQSRERSLALSYLLKTALWTPLYTVAWYVDEIFFPLYRNEKIDSPVFILSQPRSGTTTVHRTLSADRDAFFSVKHIEWRLPFIFFHKLVGYLGLSEWLDNLPYWSGAAGKNAHKMHPMLLGSFEEDGVLFEERFFAHPFILTRFPFEGIVRDRFEPTGQEHVLRLLNIHERVIRKVKYLRGGGERRYLGKEVACISLGSFWYERYSDATFVTIGRQSSVVVPSYFRLMRESVKSKTGRDPVELPWFDDFVASNLAVISNNALRQCDLFVETLPPEQVVALSFDDFFADDPARSFRELAQRLDCRVLTEIGHHGSASEDLEDPFFNLDLTAFTVYDNWVRQLTNG